MNEFAIHVNLCIDDLKFTMNAIEMAIKSPNTTMAQTKQLTELYDKYDAVVEQFNIGDTK
jgi:hypothetical protein